MNILHVAPVVTHRPNGPSGSVVNLCHALVAEGHKVGILSSKPLTEPLKTVDPRVVILPAPKKAFRNPWFISKDWFSIVEEKMGRPDVVCVNGIYIPFQVAFAMQAAEKKKWPYIVAPRGSFRMLAQQIKPWKKVLGNILFANAFMQKASAIHALAKEENDDILRFFPRARTFISPNGVSEELFNLSGAISPDSLRSVPSGAFILGFVGRMYVKVKGLDLLLGALKIIEDRHPALDIRVLLIGPFHSPADETAMVKMVARLKYPDRVVLLGTMMGNKKWPYLLRSDAFVHTSRFEGMPNAVLEAMAVGKACLVTPGTNMGSIINDSAGGWVTDPSPQAIADKLVYMAAHRDEVAERGKQAQAYVRQHLTWRQIARSYVQQIKAVLNG